MSTRTVVVLCPNGRRQSLKVNNNSTNLQILEDACNKQGLKSEEFDLKHSNKALDLTSTVQFSNLPNNAQLELVKSTKPRKETSVQIAIQSENGQRAVETFPPSTYLWEIVNWFHNKFGNSENLIPMCVYMRRKIVGEDELRKTTLRSLGLVSGSAVIRLSYRSLEDINKPSFQTVQVVKEEEATQTESEAQINSSSEEKSSAKRPSTMSAGFEAARSSPVVSVENAVKMETDEQSRPTSPPILVGNDRSTTLKVLSLAAADITLQMDQRRAYIFSLDDIEHIPSFDQLPEDFFELTVEDVRLLMADLKRQRRELETKPLQTTQMKEAQLKRKAEKYPETVIRIFFPDRVVLQGNFKATETVSDVMSFVRHFLRDQSLNFYLYTTPPKRKLGPQIQLIAASLVPGANIYFGNEARKTNAPEPVLLPEMYSQISAPPATLLPKPSNIDEREQDLKMDIVEPDPEPSTSYSSIDRVEGRTSRNPPLPKWLKLGKK